MEFTCYELQFVLMPVTIGLGAVRTQCSVPEDPEDAGQYRFSSQDCSDR